MQFPAERPEFFDQRFFDEVVDVFGAGVEFFQPRGIRPGPLGNLVERRECLLHFCRSENADGLQSFSPGAIHGNLVRQETAIECKRALKRVELFVRCALEASAPQPIVFAFSHLSLEAAKNSLPEIAACQGRRFLCRGAACCAPRSKNYCLLPSAFALGRTVTGNAKRLMKPSASFGL